MTQCGFYREPYRFQRRNVADIEIVEIGLKQVGHGGGDHAEAQNEQKYLLRLSLGSGLMQIQCRN